MIIEEGLDSSKVDLRPRKEQAEAITVSDIKEAESIKIVQNKRVNTYAHRILNHKSVPLKVRKKPVPPPPLRFEEQQSPQSPKQGSIPRRGPKTTKFVKLQQIEAAIKRNRLKQARLRRNQLFKIYDQKS